MTTDVLDAAPPALSPDQAADVARTRFGLEAAATAMVSERDQNFRLTDADGGSWVLKVSNAAEDRGVVEMEVAAVERIAMLDPALPVPVARATIDGSPIASADVDGTTHLVRLLPLLPGRNVPATELDAEAVARIGEVVARIGDGAPRLLPFGGRPADLVGPAAPAGAGAAGATHRGLRPARAAGTRARPLRRARRAGTAATAGTGHPQRRHARQPAPGRPTGT